MEQPQISAFDPNQFLQAQQTEVNETLPPLPEDNPASPDTFYTAVIGQVKQESGLIGKGDRVGEPWVSIIIPLKLAIPQELQEKLGYPAEYQMTDRAFLDLTPARTVDNAKGKNRQQKTYRDALDLNKQGDVFSWQQTVGGVVKVKVKHEIFEGRIVAKVGAIYRRS